VVELRDNELDALIAEAEGSSSESNPEAIEKQSISLGLTELEPPK
jgi:hypothetical protein